MSSEHADGEGSAGTRSTAARSRAEPVAAESDGPASVATGADSGDATPTGRDTDPPEGAAEPPETLGRRGWILVGVVVLCFLVIPGLIYLRPAAPGGLGLPFLVAMLALPLLPAALLGATAVWSAVTNEERRGRE